MKCANCNKTIIPEISCSTVVELQKVSEDAYTFFQCEQGQDFRAMNWQHFCCSLDCMKEMLTKCINEHNNENDLHGITEGYSRFHKFILSNNLNCSLCNNPIQSGYRFCLTFATPIFGNINDHRDLSNWCCSLEHAKEQAINLVNAIHGRGFPYP